MRAQCRTEAGVSALRAHADRGSRDVRMDGHRRESAVEITQLPREVAQPIVQLCAPGFEFQALCLCFGPVGRRYAAGPVQTRQAAIQLIETAGQGAKLAGQPLPIGLHTRRRVARRALNPSVDAEDG